MDDDTPDYDEDYSFSDSYDQDEDVRQEFELDEILLNADEDPEASSLRLSEFARDYTSICCTRAALELLKLNPSSSSFMVLVNAISHAPAEVDSYIRTSTLESGWMLLERHLQAFDDVDKNSIVHIQEEACMNLKHSDQIRPYFQLILCATRTFITFKYFKQAKDLLWGLFYEEIRSYESIGIWVPPLLHAASILKLELLVLRDPIDTFQVREVVNSIKTSEIVTHPVQSCIVDEVNARLCLEVHQFQESRAILEKVVRGHEESQGLQRSPDMLARSTVLLILVTAILGDVLAGNKARTELKAEDEFEIVHHALNISHCIQFPVARSMQFMRELAEIQKWLDLDDWKLGSVTLVEELKSTFVKSQLEHMLAPYERVSWTTIKAQVEEFQRPDSMLSSPFVRSCFTQICHEKGFQLNLVDETIDRKRVTSDWTSISSNFSELSRAIPLPDIYVNHQASRQIQSKESDILNKWKHTSQDPKTAKPRKHHLDVDAGSMQLLQNTLNKHRDTMLN